MNKLQRVCWQKYGFTAEPVVFIGLNKQIGSLTFTDIPIFDSTTFTLQ